MENSHYDRHTNNPDSPEDFESNLKDEEALRKSSFYKAAFTALRNSDVVYSSSGNERFESGIDDRIKAYCLAAEDYIGMSIAHLVERPMAEDSLKDIADKVERLTEVFGKMCEGLSPQQKIKLLKCMHKMPSPQQKIKLLIDFSLRYTEQQGQDDENDS